MPCQEDGWTAHALPEPDSHCVGGHRGCWAKQGYKHICPSSCGTFTEDGWPGRCEGMVKITDLKDGETCQMRCMMSPLCSVWSIESTSDPYGASTCWNGMLGTNCCLHRQWDHVGLALVEAPNKVICFVSRGYGDDENVLTPVRAQRLQHGTYRVLMQVAGVQILGLHNSFGDAACWQSVPNPTPSGQLCKLSALALLFAWDKHSTESMPVRTCLSDTNFQSRRYCLQQLGRRSEALQTGMSILLALPVLAVLQDLWLLPGDASEGNGRLPPHHDWHLPLRESAQRGRGGHRGWGDDSAQLHRLDVAHPHGDPRGKRGVLGSAGLCWSKAAGSARSARATKQWVYLHGLTCSANHSQASAHLCKLEDKLFIFFQQVLLLLELF